MLGRRGLFGLGAALAAPALIRTPGLLMPVRPALSPPIEIYVLLENAPVGTCVFVTQTRDAPVVITGAGRDAVRSATGTNRTRAKFSQVVAWKVDGPGWALSGDLAG